MPSGLASPGFDAPPPRKGHQRQTSPRIPLLAIEFYHRRLFTPSWVDASYTRAKAVSLVRSFLRNSPHEQMVPIMLNARHEIIAMYCASMGAHNTLLLEGEDIFIPASQARADAIVLVHNHPMGPLPLKPSDYDLELTEALVKDGAKRWHIPIFDHLILSNVVRDVFSFRHANLLLLAVTFGQRLIRALLDA